MSSEQLTNTNNLKTESVDIYKKNTLEKTKVDINCLLVKLREKEKLQKQENLLFFGVIALILTTIGIIATL